MQVLALNAGSSSLKYALYEEGLEEAERGAITRLGLGSRLTTRRHGEYLDREVAAQDHRAAVHIVRQRLGSRWLSDGLIVHRIVHGGPEFSGPTLLQPQIVGRLAALEALAPLHMRAALGVIDAAQEVFGRASASIGVFDTALFASLPASARDYGIPEAWRTALGVRRYGFHGFAHQCLRDAALQLPAAAAAPPRIVTLQLGGGCSVAAFRGPDPIAISMGFSPLEGLVMPTRSGSVDVAAGLYLILEHGFDPAAMLRALNEESGLLALSGVSADPEQLVQRAQRGHAASKLALDVFFRSVQEYVGAYAGLLGGLDVIALGGGIAEHVPEFRSRTLQCAAWLGCESAPGGDFGPDRSAAVLSSKSSRVMALLVAVDEERLMAEQAIRHVRRRRDRP